MNRDIEFAVGLKFFETEWSISRRLLPILNFINKQFNNVPCEIHLLEVTGVTGDKLCNKVDGHEPVLFDLPELMNALRGDIQIIELKLIIRSNRAYFEILVVDGQDVDILSNQRSILTKAIMGEFIFLDLGLFNIGKISE